MGVPVGDAEGGQFGQITLLQCRHCGEHYETDDSMLNDCPECGFRDFEIRNSASSPDAADWRDRELIQ